MKRKENAPENGMDATKASPSSNAPRSAAGLLRKIVGGDEKGPAADQLSAELKAYICRGVAGLDLYDLQNVARFVDIVQNESGCNTPAESFIMKLVGYHYGRGLSPEKAVAG